MHPLQKFARSIVVSSVALGCHSLGDGLAPDMGLEAGLPDWGPERGDAADLAFEAPTEPAWIEVTYSTSPQPTWLEATFFEFRDNDFFKFADNRARVSIVGGAAFDRFELFVDDAPLPELSLALDGGHAVELRLPTERWPEGIRKLRYTATRSVDGVVATGEEEVRVLFNVTRMAPGADGTLWLGTFEHGLVAWDPGAEAVDASDDRYTVIGGQGLEMAGLGDPELLQLGEVTQPGGRCILALTKASHGVWVGTLMGGVTYLDDGGTPLDRSDDAAAHMLPPIPAAVDDPWEASLARAVTALVPDGGSGLWVGTLQGLFHLDHRSTPLNDWDDRWTMYPPEDAYDPNIMALATDSRGHLFVASTDLSADGTPRNTARVLIPGDSRAADRWGHLNPPDDFPAAAFAVAVGPSGLVYWGTSNGVYGVDIAGTPDDATDDRWWHLGRDEGLPDDDVAVVSPRPDGRLWVGTFDACGGDGGGLALVEGAPCDAGACPPPIVVYRRTDGLIDDDVSSLIERPDGSVFVGSFNALAASAIVNLQGGSEDGPRSCDDSPFAERNLAPGLAEAQAEAEAESNLPPSESSFSGNDGLSVIDPGRDLKNHDDDRVENF